MLRVGLFGFFVLFSKSSKKWLGRREGNGWAGGNFSFLLTKDWPLKNKNKKLPRKTIKIYWVKFALEGFSGQALCGCRGGVECLHDILYHKIDRMFLTCFFPLYTNKVKDFSLS